jgi:hypothetical protein
MRQLPLEINNSQIYMKNAAASKKTKYNEDAQSVES